MSQKKTPEALAQDVGAKGESQIQDKFDEKRDQGAQSAQEALDQSFGDDSVFKPILEMLKPFLDRLKKVNCFKPIWDKITAKMQQITRDGNFTALPHFVLIEMSPFFIFWFTVYNAAKKFINAVKRDIDVTMINVAYFTTRGAACGGGSSSRLLSSSNSSYQQDYQCTEYGWSSSPRGENGQNRYLLGMYTKIGECVAATTEDEVWAQPAYDFHSACFHQDWTSAATTYGLEAKSANGNTQIGYINVGCLVMVSGIVAMCLYKYVRALGLRPMNHADGRYLQFCYQLSRTRAYRICSGALVLVAVMCIGLFVGIGLFGGQLMWVINNFAVDFIVIAVLVSKLFNPKRPTFQYCTKDFSSIHFRMGSFLESSTSFAGTLQKAVSVIQGDVGPNVKGQEKALKDLLRDPDTKMGEGKETWKVAKNALLQLNPPSGMTHFIDRTIGKAKKAEQEVTKAKKAWDSVEPVGP